MASLRDPLPDGQGSVNRAFYWQNRTPTVREGILRQDTHDSFYAVTALIWSNRVSAPHGVSRGVRTA